MVFGLRGGEHAEDAASSGVSGEQAGDKQSIDRRTYMSLGAATVAAVVSAGVESTIVSGQSGQTYTTTFSEYAS
jgi:hypothetical protein